MNPVSLDIKDYLIESAAAVTSIALVFGTTLHIGREPEKPNNVVTIFDASGSPPFLSYDTEVLDGGYEYPSFQIRIRHSRYDTAMLIAAQISRVLHGFGNDLIDDTLYTLIEALDNPFLLEWDDNNRAKVVVNFAAQRTKNDTLET